MELGGEEWLGLVAYALVGAVVHIHEQRLPVLAERSVVHCEAVVLRSYEAAVGADHTYRLVVAAVAIFKFICPCAAGPREQLVAHTYSENRLVLSESGAYVRDGVGAELGVARTVGYEEAVVVQSGEVVVPRHAYELYAPVNQAAEYVVLDAAIDEADFFAGAFVVAYHLLAADYRYLVVAVRVVHTQAAGDIQKHIFLLQLKAHALLQHGKQHVQPAAVEARTRSLWRAVSRRRYQRLHLYQEGAHPLHRRRNSIQLYNLLIISFIFTNNISQ